MWGSLDGREVVDVVEGRLWQIARDTGLQWVAKVVAKVRCQQQDWKTKLFQEKGKQEEKKIASFQNYSQSACVSASILTVIWDGFEV